MNNPEHYRTQMGRWQKKLDARDSMPKSAAKDFEKTVTRFLEESWDVIVAPLYGMRTDASTEIIFSQKPSVKNLDKRVAKLEKLRKQYPDEVPVIDDVIGKVQALEKDAEPYLKLASHYQERADATVKEKQDKANAPAPEMPKASYEAVKTFERLLRENTQELESDLKHRISSQLHRYADEFREKTADEPVNRLSKVFPQSSMAHHSLQRLVVRDSPVNSPRDPLKLADDVDQRIEKTASQDARDILDQFRIKTASKLAPVAEKFPPITEATLRVTTGSGNIEGDLDLAFEDDRSFTMRSQIVPVVNQFGTFFARYPTTFHNYSVDGEVQKRKLSLTEMTEIGNGASSPSP